MGKTKKFKRMKERHSLTDVLSLQASILVSLSVHMMKTHQTLPKDIYSPLLQI